MLSSACLPPAGTMSTATRATQSGENTVSWRIETMRHFGITENGLTRSRPEDRKVWYLVLQIGFPEYTRHPGAPMRRMAYFDNRAAAHHVKAVNCECAPLGITVRNLNISINSRRDQFEHYVFRFRRYLRDDSSAVRFVEALAFGFSIVAGPLIDPADPLALRVPDALIRGEHDIPLWV